MVYMLGLKHMPTSRLSTAFMVLSVVMLLVGSVLVPSSGATIVTSALWTAGSMALIGIWVAVIFELVRRYVGMGGSSDSSGER